MPKTRGGRFRGRFRGMNCTTSNTRDLASTLASHGFQRKQATFDCQSGWVNSERPLYRPSSTRHAPKRTLVSAERAQDRGESPEDAGRTSQDNCPVEGSSSDSVGGRAARTNIVLFNTRICSGPPAGRRSPRPCSHRMSPREAERMSHVHMALLERGEYWGTCVTGLLSRCTASLAGEQDGCDVDKRRHPPGVGRLVGGGNWWRIMDEPSAQPPDSLDAALHFPTSSISEVVPT